MKDTNSDKLLPTDNAMSEGARKFIAFFFTGDASFQWLPILRKFEERMNQITALWSSIGHDPEFDDFELECFLSIKERGILLSDILLWEISYTAEQWYAIISSDNTLEEKTKFNAIENIDKILWEISLLQKEHEIIVKINDIRNTVIEGIEKKMTKPILCKNFGYLKRY